MTRGYPIGQGRRAGITSITILIIILLGVAAVGFVIFWTSSANPADKSTSDRTTTAAYDYVFTNDSSPYFANGYYLRAVSPSEMFDGDTVVVGPTSFRFELPSNIELGTSTTGGTTTVVTTIMDYQCGISLGSRKFFRAHLADGSDFMLDYCLVLNTAIQRIGYANSDPPWNLWQISKGTIPIVAIHMSGKGESVSLVELWVGK